MIRPQIIVIGTSKGGTRALQFLLNKLPDGFRLPVVIVLHRDKDSDEVLVSMIQKSTRLRVSDVVDKELVSPGRVYLAPANYHLLVDRPLASLSREIGSGIDNQSPTPNFALSTDAPVLLARPSIDVLFQSAADIYGQTTIGVVLTGASRDGEAGLAAIKSRGGSTLVQDPATAESALMPEAAASHADKILPLSGIAKEFNIVS